MNDPKDINGFAQTSNLDIFLNRMISAYFTVSPIKSYKAFELFDMPDGEQFKLTAYTFAVAYKGRLDDSEMTKKAYQQIWETIKSSWPVGTFLMWRCLPTIEEYDIGDGWTTKLYLRLSSFQEPATNKNKKAGEDALLISEGV